MRFRCVLEVFVSFPITSAINIDDSREKGLSGCASILNIPLLNSGEYRGNSV